MQITRIIFAFCLLGALCLIASAIPSLNIVSVGFNGYYRLGTVMPVAVTIENPDETFEGELHIVPQSMYPGTKNKYLARLTFPRASNKIVHLYYMPEPSLQTVNVELWKGAKKLAVASYANCKELADLDRLMVVVGGNGSSFNTLNQSPLLKSTPDAPRPWNFNQATNIRRGSYPSSSTTGLLQVAYTASETLPVNAECYGSVTTLALMSDITENRLDKNVQQAITVWVAGGGTLLLSGGGINARFNDPFFTNLLSSPNKQTANKGITVSPHDKGQVIQLPFDPDITSTILPNDQPVMRTLFQYDRRHLWSMHYQKLSIQR